ncbi:BrnT family toxin [Bradyrhizobium sp. USDA 10063]
MVIVWDEPKRQANLVKHGLDFADLDETFFDNALLRPTHSRRWRGIGVSAHGVIAVVFFALGAEAISVISLRPASRQERKLYAESKEEP